MKNPFHVYYNFLCLFPLQTVYLLLFLKYTAIDANWCSTTPSFVRKFEMFNKNLFSKHCYVTLSTSFKMATFTYRFLMTLKFAFLRLWKNKKIYFWFPKYLHTYLRLSLKQVNFNGHIFCVLLFETFIDIN